MWRLVCVVIGVVALLSGCGVINPVTITEEMVGETGQVVNTVVTETSDVDVVRSTNFTKMRMNRDNKQAAAHNNTGLKIKFQLVDLGNGAKAYLPEEISMKPELRFQDPMPLQEMENPIYRYASDIFKSLFGTVLAGYGIFVAGEVHQNSVEAAQPRYGTYAPQSWNNSFNPTTSTSYAPPGGVAP